VVQDHPGHLLMRFVAQPGADKDLIQKVLEQRMPMVGLKFKYVPALERNANGKRRYFVDGPQPLAPISLPSLVTGPTPARKVGALASWRWLAAAMVLAVAVIAMSVLVLGVGGGHPATARAHHRRESIVHVKALACYEITAPAQWIE
jgi:hypothetical protein